MSRWTLYPGSGRIPDAASPDLRARSHTIAADVEVPVPTSSGVVLAHGDRNAGYALRLDAGRLVHDYVHHGHHTLTRSTYDVPVGRPVRLAVDVRRTGIGADVTLLVDGQEAGTGNVPLLARARTGYTGVDVGCDRGLTVGGYPAPARFPGLLRCVEVEAGDDQWLDLVAAWEIEGATG
ncbi:MAG: arylsulfatase [Nocardioidaceae bacterium]|nr:arylsulfatase [Nocardioidaceae bacterium]